MKQKKKVLFDIFNLKLLNSRSFDNKRLYTSQQIYILDTSSIANIYTCTKKKKINKMPQ